MNFGQKVCLDEISDGHLEYKTRSLSHISEKPCVCSRGHIFSQIIMKFCQNVCLHEISDWFENGSCEVNN